MSDKPLKKHTVERAFMDMLVIILGFAIVAAAAGLAQLAAGWAGF